MSDLKNLQNAAIHFRDDRDWEQFHDPKSEAVSLWLEAAELLEHFQWATTRGQMLEHVHENKEDVADEVCDVLYWVLVMAHDLDIDLPSEVTRKLEKSGRKYPIEKSKGQAKKYTEFQNEE